MITDLILIIFYGVINILLSPLTVINVGVDFITSMPVIYQFLEVVAYILPWSNLVPLVSIVFALFVFRGAISVISKVRSFLPF